MRALPWRVAMMGASLLTLAVALASPGRAEDPAPQGADVSAAPMAQVDVVVPLPEAPTALIASEAAPSAEAKVDIPPPDLPAVTVVIEPDPAPPAPPVRAAETPKSAPPNAAPARAEQAAAPTLDPAAVRDALRDALKAFSEGKGSRPVARLARKERDALTAFYAERQNEPAWYPGGQATPAARGALAQIASAEQDALDPTAYPAATLAAGAGAADVAEAELALSAAAVAYARDARGARIEPSRLSNLLTPDLDLPAAPDVLNALLSAADAGRALAAYQPPHAGYWALKAKLHEMREATGAVRPGEDDLEGPPLRYGSVDRRVPLIRAKLNLDPKPDQAYDDDLIAAIKALQRSHRVRATGIFDQRASEILTGRPRVTVGSFAIGDVIANMERWRWLPHDLGDRRIEVNLPEFALRLYENGAVVHRTRVIVGKTTSPTPVFSHMMDHVIVNPSWYLPPSILKNEFLPKLAEDPNYAARLGYEVIRRGNSVSVRQPPGERNALGFIKFMFPNQHAVYLHDTPSRSLFGNERRAFSHGCVRVENPFRLADFVLGDQGYDEKRLRGLIGKGERTIKFRQPLPIHLTYFTISVDENGRLQRREDLYGYDGRIKTALGVGPDGRRFAHLASPPALRPISIMAEP
ncbi:L,D-transpeptidase family protein [Alsobacter sp. SYSU BS001988]